MAGKGLARDQRVAILVARDQTRICSMLAGGRAIFATASPETQLSYVLEGCCLMVPPEAPEMMAKGLRRLAGDAPLRERLGKAARVYAERHLDVAAVTVAAPLTLAIALGVKLSSPGPVLFRQRRHGLSGKVVGVWKFRGMGVQEDGDEIPQTRRADPRVTRFGAFLRRTSLDELPQFFNVLQGHISVVGPRPHAVAHNER